MKKILLFMLLILTVSGYGQNYVRERDVPVYVSYYQLPWSKPPTYNTDLRYTGSYLFYGTPTILKKFIEPIEQGRIIYLRDSIGLYEIINKNYTVDDNMKKVFNEHNARLIARGGFFSGGIPESQILSGNPLYVWHGDKVWKKAWSMWDTAGINIQMKNPYDTLELKNVMMVGQFGLGVPSPTSQMDIAALSNVSALKLKAYRNNQTPVFSLTDSSGTNGLDFNIKQLNLAIATKSVYTFSSLTSGTGNFLLFSPGKYLSTGSNNDIWGSSNANELSKGSNNFFCGRRIYPYSQRVNNSIAVGRSIGPGAGYLTDSTWNNILVGDELFQGTGHENTMIGYLIGALSFPGNYMFSGSHNIFLGQRIARDPIASGVGVDSNIAIGFNSFYHTKGAKRNICIGIQAGVGNSTTHFSGSDNVFIGLNTANEITTGYKNIAIGTGAGLEFYGAIGNVAVGDSAMGSPTTYPSNAVNNTAIGRQAGTGNRGTGNIFVGWKAGHLWTGNYAMFLGGRDSLSGIFFDLANARGRWNGTQDIYGGTRIFGSKRTSDLLLARNDISSPYDSTAGITKRGVLYGQGVQANGANESYLINTSSGGYSSMIASIYANSVTVKDYNSTDTTYCELTQNPTTATTLIRSGRIKDGVSSVSSYDFDSISFSSAVANNRQSPTLGTDTKRWSQTYTKGLITGVDTAYFLSDTLRIASTTHTVIVTPTAPCDGTCGNEYVFDLANCEINGNSVEILFAPDVYWNSIQLIPSLDSQIYDKRSKLFLGKGGACSLDDLMSVAGITCFTYRFYDGKWYMISMLND